MSIKSLQEFLGVVADGVWGPHSQAALDAIISTSSASPTANPEPTPATQVDGQLVDERSEKNISTLLEQVKPLARGLVNAAKEQGITIKVTSGTRTFEEQDKLFNQGGVTKARGGYSNHNYGLAFDVTVFEGALPKWDGPEYATCGKLGKSLGLSWGGDWKSIVDEPHFELRPKWASNMTESEMIAELRARHAVGHSYF